MERDDETLEALRFWGCEIGWAQEEGVSIDDDPLVWNGPEVEGYYYVFGPRSVDNRTGMVEGAGKLGNPDY